jgi:hypothetical protein
VLIYPDKDENLTGNGIPVEGSTVTLKRFVDPDGRFRISTVPEKFIVTSVVSTTPLPVSYLQGVISATASLVEVTVIKPPGENRLLSNSITSELAAGGTVKVRLLTYMSSLGLILGLTR